MSIFNWIRDLLGIKKDYKETAKIELEVSKLKTELSHINKPDMAEIMKYGNFINSIK